jgi:nucleoside-diphosphate-sugar epimerase
VGNIEPEHHPEDKSVSANLDLHGKTILVTGASGFIGSRLVEYLVNYANADVRALVRGFGRAAHIARMQVKLIPGDITNPDSIRKAMAGCEIVFHCAAGMAGEDEERKSATLDGTRNMLDAAVEAKVKRFVHVSSVAVYGPDPGPVVDENTPLIPSDDVYADSKLEADKLVSEYGTTKGLPIVILRPAIVYGPRAGGWTLGPIQNLRTGRLTLLDGGEGIANQVYIDDVVQAMLLAATRPEAIGETFVISGGAPVTWKEFLGYYARLLKIEIPDLSVESINSQQKQAAKLRKPQYMGLTFLASPHAWSVISQVRLLAIPARLLDKMLPSKVKKSLTNEAISLRQLKLNPPAYPRPWIIKLYTAKGICKIDKAQRLLGYEPQVSLEEGMRITEEWLRYNCVITD